MAFNSSTSQFDQTNLLLKNSASGLTIQTAKEAGSSTILHISTVRHYHFIEAADNQVTYYHQTGNLGHLRSFSCTCLSGQHLGG